MSSQIIGKLKCGFLLSIAPFLMTLTGCSGQITQANTETGVVSTPDKNGNYLKRVQQRGYLVCGVSGEIPGFSFVDFNSKYAGMDVDFCRAVAAALFDDPDKVEFREFPKQEKAFEALQSGEIDLLSRNTTQTLKRDTKDNLEFTPPIFYDYQGIMVKKDSGIESVADLEGKSICVGKDTTSYDNLQDYLAQRKISYNPLVSEEKEYLYNSYEYDNCQAITGDSSQLVARKILLANPTHHKILPQKVAREPLAPAVLHGNSRWYDAIKWITFALIQAEELNINSVNLNIYKNSQDAEIKKFLGGGVELGSQIGLSDDFAFRIVKHVGNYGQIYDRNIGEPFGLERGQNALWQDGGLMYSPPFN